MSNALTKADAKRQKALKADSLRAALKNGGSMVWLSCLVMGLGNIMAGQTIKGLLFLLVEIGFIVFMVIPGGGFSYIALLPSLGWQEMGEVYNEAKGIYEYTMGHKSQLILLYGVASICAIALFVIFWQYTVRNGARALSQKKAGEKVNTFKEDMLTLLDENVHRLLMTPPTACLAIFTILPLVYMMCMAFTNYSKETDNLILFDWVGIENFINIFNPNSAVGRQFGDVLAWTLIWAFFATFLNFFMGTIMAMIIQRKSLKMKGLWRGCLSMTIAVTQFVSMMVIRSMMMPDGIINRLLLDAGWIATKLPFLTNATWAKVTVIIINLWVGIPYTIMQVTGILQNIPAEQYEAATIDGANVFQTFFNITLPYMIFVMTPQIISSFTGNINNFNVIYLLTRGEPLTIGNSAGGTDLLVTWLYKLSVDQQKYNLAAVIGIFTFVVLAVVSLVTYRSSGSYKDEEGFK